MKMEDVKISTTFFVIVPTLNVFAQAWSSVKNNIGNFGWKMCMSDVWWTSSWVLVGRCVKSQDVPKTILAILYACNIKSQ